MKKGLIVLLSGPSGVGKGTIKEEILKDPTLNLVWSVSMTTRAPRYGEIHGRDYFFVSHEEFNSHLESANFLEHATFVGNHYGTPRDYVESLLKTGKNVLIEIEVAGAKQLLSQVDPRDVVSIYLLPPNIEELEKRIRGRGTEDEEKIMKRLARAQEEMVFKDQYQYHVINNDLKECIDKVKQIIQTRINER